MHTVRGDGVEKSHHLYWGKRGNFLLADSQLDVSVDLMTHIHTLRHLQGRSLSLSAAKLKQASWKILHHTK